MHPTIAREEALRAAIELSRIWGQFGDGPASSDEVVVAAEKFYKFLTREDNDADTQAVG